MMYKLIIKIIRHLNLPISDETIKETLMVHPLYPTLSSVSDAFDLWKIDHLVAKLTFDQINDLDIPIISSLRRNNLILVMKTTQRYVWFRDSDYGLKRIDKQNFMSSWDGVSILIQNIDEAKDYNTRNKNNHSEIFRILVIALVLLVVICGVLACYLNWSGDILLTVSTKVLLLVNNIIGILSCYLLYVGKSNKSSFVFNKLCKKGKYVDCEKVAKSLDDKFPLFNYLLEFAFGYFTTIVIWLALAASSQGWTFPLYEFFVLSVPIMIASIITQLFHIKKLCVLCCAILLCLLINVLNVADVVFDIRALLKYIILFSLVTTLYILLSKTYMYKSKYYQFRRSNARIMFDIKTLQAHLSEYRLKTPKCGMHWGNLESNNELTVIVSLKCKYCKELVRKLLWLKDIYKNIHYNIVFDIPYSNEDHYKYVSYLYFLYEQGDTDGFIEMLDSVDQKKHIHSFPDIIENETVRNYIEEQRRFVENANVEYLPSILINGRLLSNYYNVNDIIPLVQKLSKL